jgi:hypothetical protein
MQQRRSRRVGFRRNRSFCLPAANRAQSARKLVVTTERINGEELSQNGDQSDEAIK